MRLAVLFTRLSGYMARCLATFAEDHDAELWIVRHAPTADAPYAAELFAQLGELHDRARLDPREIARRVQAFGADGVLLAGWADRGYLQAARRLRRSGISVVAGADAQWQGTLRQTVARAIAPLYLHTAIDALWVPGERQRRFAERLGYRGERCWSGYYTADVERFVPAAQLGRGFLFAGRYLPRKGLDVLVEAYRRYRSSVADPWPLVCAGAGEQRALLEAPGVEDRGFVQPDELPGVLQAAGAFVLPSRWEPWGVVLHEAAACGLPLIASSAVGAADHLIRPGGNGHVFPSEDPQQLAAQLRAISAASAEARAVMGALSSELARQYSPSAWAETLNRGLRALRRARGVA